MALFKKRKDMYDEEEIEKKLNDMEFEKGDMFAMFIAAMITFLPAVLLLLGLFSLILWIIFT
ncbi:hypothetical protein AOC36_03930 [Erysipelothrix larvae]|uniref:Uncharacterized protein n=1 Tax=Erysipelothrix larvae TaxID=1514105 RepID=A0A120JTK4_9FIRM|nr:hypothetical protein [Erysipelothrix larvae]AMC93151.1 hypothetical protein AOC36_03930 [Erysipelothrix larvae]